jgi:hypothetical protein
VMIGGFHVSRSIAIRRRLPRVSGVGRRRDHARPGKWRSAGGSPAGCPARSPAPFYGARRPNLAAAGCRWCPRLIGAMRTKWGRSTPGRAARSTARSAPSSIRAEDAPPAGRPDRRPRAAEP